MRLEYLDFRSGQAQKNSDSLPERFNTNINISNASLEGDKLNLDFQYTVVYEPDKSMLVLNGMAKFASPKAKDAYDEWIKHKRISGEAGEAILNALNYSSSANMVFFSRVFNLIPPLTLPTLKLQEKK